MEEKDRKLLRMLGALSTRFSSGSSEDGAAEDMQDRQFVNRLNSFYDEVIGAIRDVGSILIIGPGEAKGELVKRLERDEIRGESLALKPLIK